jgi:RNA polymerase sigma-70 factor (ECF subfamily)
MSARGLALESVDESQRNRRSTRRSLRPGGRAGVDGETLLAAAQKGSVEAFGALCEAIRGHLLLAAHQDFPRKLRGRIGASDLVQDAVVAGHRGFHAFRGGSTAEFLGWMRAILRNTMGDSLRRNRGARRSPAGENCRLSAIGSNHGALADTAAERPEPLAIKAEEAALVASALETLPTDQRRAMWLRHWEGMTFPEIGATMGRSDEAARKLWCRAYQRFSETLGVSDEDAPHRPDAP